MGVGELIVERQRPLGRGARARISDRVGHAGIFAQQQWQLARPA